MPTHWMPSSNQILTQNDHSRSFKVIRFGVNEEQSSPCVFWRLKITTSLEKNVAHEIIDIAAMHVLQEMSLEHNNKVYVCFVDYKKAYNRVNWQKLTKILQNIGADVRNRKLIWNLYKNH